MHHAAAHPEQINSIPEIVRNALRAAATAPTVFEALDIAGEALRQVADIAKSGVHHG